MRTAHRLDQLCEVVMGQAPDGAAYNDSGDGWLLIAGAGDFGEGVPAPKKFTSQASKLSRAGDIILGIRASIGEMVLSDGIYCLGRGVAGLRAGPRMESRYLWHWLGHSRSVLASKAKGATFKQVNRNDIGELEVLLPPIPEQRRIAEILDRAEALRGKRRTALAQLDTVAQAIFLDLFGDPTRDRMRFGTAALGDLGDWQSGGTPPRADSSLFQGDIPWFSSGELGEMVLSKSAEFISARALDESSARRVPQGSLMLGMYDTAALKASISGVEASCNQAIAFSTLSRNLALPAFIYFAIVIGREHFRRLQRGVRQKNLNLTMVREIRVPLPPLALQHEFARRVAAVEKLKAAHRASLAQFDALFASLQHRAFRGEL